MNWDGEKQALKLKEKTEKKAKPESIHLVENIGEDKGLKKFQKYKTIFKCSYTEVKE